jgi:hypothetical protein
MTECVDRYKRASTEGERGGKEESARHHVAGILTMLLFFSPHCYNNLISSLVNTESWLVLLPSFIVI